MIPCILLFKIKVVNVAWYKDTVENNEHMCFIAIFPPKLNVEIVSTLWECHNVCNTLRHLKLDFEVILMAAGFL